MGDFKKWGGDPSKGADDFERGGLIPLYRLWFLYRSPTSGLLKGCVYIYVGVYVFILSHLSFPSRGVQDVGFKL